MGNTLYLECHAGISGDMTVAALLDLGASKEKLLAALERVPADGFEIKISRVSKSGVDCMDFDVVLDREHENHDHDMAYLHGENAPVSHDTGHHENRENIPVSHDTAHHENQENTHVSHDAVHHEDHTHHHHHEHRGMAEVTRIIEQTGLTRGAEKLAKRIFQILAEAESKAHNVPVSQVHFHEVGAIDSIVDVIAAAVCLDDLDIQEVIVPRLCEGTGTVRCQHGVLPVPVPAVANIAARYALPIEFIDLPGEFVTPTGAAIVAAVMTGQKLPKPCRIQKIGMGAGKRNYERPSIVRAMLIDSQMEPETEGNKEEHICKLESDIDDCTGEALGFVMEELFAAGARDVYYFPVYMKKNRPGYQLNVLCMPEDEETLADLIFRHTTTIGIRKQIMERTVLKREIREVDTVYGNVRMKVCKNHMEIYGYPEYEDVAAICRREGKAFQEVYAELAGYIQE